MRHWRKKKPHLDSPHFRRINIDWFETVETAESALHGNCNVSWPQTVCPGVYFGAIEGISIPECVRFTAGKLPSFTVGHGSAKVFLYSRSCHLHMWSGMGRSPTDSGTGPYCQCHFGVHPWDHAMDSRQCLFPGATRR